MAEAFSDYVSAKMGDCVEQGDALGLAGNCNIHRADDVFQPRVEHFGGAAERGFDALLVPFDQAIELL